MAHYREIDLSPRLLPVNLDEQLVPGTFAHALHHLVDDLDPTEFDAHYRNGSAPAATVQQDRPRKCGLAFVASAQHGHAASNNQDNTIAGRSPKAQGKSFMRPGLTGSLLTELLGICNAE